MVSRVKVSVASGRGVAERWRRQYQNKDGNWTRTVKGDSEATHNALCALGPDPDIDAVAIAIGNQGWAHLSCSGCGTHVTRAVSFGTEYCSADEVLMCQLCLQEGLRAISN